MTVRQVERLGPRMVRVSFAGPALEGLAVDDPAASVRLLLPDAGGRTLAMPQWNGNEFLMLDGRRPTIRTFTPVRVDAGLLELDLDFVIHGGGAASAWSESATPGDQAAVSGPGRGYTIDPDAPAFLLAGDEAAIPAIRQLLDALPVGTPAAVYLEVAHPDARLGLPERPGVEVRWLDLPAGAPPGETLVTAVRSADLASGGLVWAAGEAAGMQRIRRHLFEELGLPRAQATVRGYWKHGRQGGGDPS